MKNYLFLLLVCSLQLAAQPNTEVYLANLKGQETTIVLSDLKNISQNEGYDNQPSFLDNNTLLYAATRNGQTDILNYNLQTGEKKWLSNTPDGSEYSPLKIPSQNAVSAIRLDKDGKQLLYSYDLSTGKSEVLIAQKKIGYHVWHSANILVATVLVDNRMDLVVINTSDMTTRVYQKNVGRSLHKIPNSNLVSYISKQNETWQIKSLDPVNGTTKDLMALPPGIEDMVWLQDNTALVAKGSAIARSNPENTGQWELFHSFQEKEINNLTRMAISPNQQFLALVSDAAPDLIVEKQVTSFNAADLEAFVICFSEDVLVRNYPTDTLYVGSKRMTDSYRRFMDNNPDAKVEVTKRIIIGNKVIDAETGTKSGQINKQVAIYEVNNGSISSMTFIHQNTDNNQVEDIVQQQLDAYNARDIDSFMETYTKEVQLLNFPNELISEGKDKMYESYKSFFESTPDLNCEIKNRIIIGNMVIDEEFITMNNTNFSAVAIYEVENGKIAKVTFLR
ncbi:nuclear transport factor 2 family protein [Muriicola sp. Z0-33]|uniref:nuclear transport factor 2 family protein n=1 Tax=Muriicola sp. Z0-33 TaxID=2816957 RepID=UPI0022370436|nr:nuclear transport factor 2 family protein [Muriicola sp. Z0-33]MCW5517037.1 nuclear transport factor 2 family protein [Muriicola sp. Z0-33]